jgi:phosphoribosyl-ATP pyrophosphohydrolase
MNGIGTKLDELYEVIKSRKEQNEENSYTCYLFRQGIDKILKKIGEESAELIIAAKDGDKTRITEETCDLLYHILVMLNERGIDLSQVGGELGLRAQKTGNLKQSRKVDKNS